MSEVNAPVIAIAAMELEVRPLLSKMKKEICDGLKVYRSPEFSIILSGIGPHHAERAALMAVKALPKMIVSLGFAGGLSETLKPGDLFSANAVINRSGKTISCKAVPIENTKKGILLSVDSIVETPDKKKLLRVSPLKPPLAGGFSGERAERAEGALLSAAAEAVDMESYAVAKVAEANNIPFSSIRIISDSSDESLPLDFSPAIKNGKLNPLKAIFLILKKPSSIPAILTLASRSQRYSARLAAAFQTCLIQDTY